MPSLTDPEVMFDDYYKAYFATVYKVLHWLKEDQIARDDFTRHSLAIQKELHIELGVPADEDLRDAIASCLTMTHQLFHLFTGTSCDDSE